MGLNIKLTFHLIEFIARIRHLCIATMCTTRARNIPNQRPLFLSLTETSNGIIVKSILFCLIYQISFNFHGFAIHATLYRQYDDYDLAPRRRLRSVIVLKKASDRGVLVEASTHTTEVDCGSNELKTLHP